MTERVPSYPGVSVVVGFELDGEPKVIDDGGLADWLLEAMFLKLAGDFTAEWILEPIDEGGDA